MSNTAHSKYHKLGIASLLLAATGCHKHVVLNAPPSSSSIQDRVAAYEKLQPLSTHETRVAYVGGRPVVGMIRHVDYLQLASGERVYYPEDVLPVVGRDSPTGKAAERSKLSRTKSHLFTGLFIGGIAVGVGLIALPAMKDRKPGESTNMAPIWIGSGLALGSLIFHFVHTGFASTANDEAATAFETYDSSLRNQLNLCDKGQGWSACRQ